MHRLRNVSKHYAWGSPSMIPALLGETPSGRPVAELWMGAHPTGSSRLADTGERLDEHLAARGARLPFLFKVLAADQPLSLQAHPDAAQARAGYAREQAAGVPLDAPRRNYKDDSHKPELLCATTPFHALCGFRELGRTRELLAALDCPALSALCTDDLRATFLAIMGAGPALVDAVLAACAGATGFAAERRWVLELGARHPRDPGVVLALLLNLVELAPGEAIYLPAGNLHAYLQGAGLELMASSDNVLRGGLTEKHVDVAELASVLDFRPDPVAVIAPTPVSEWESVYFTSPAAREFQLSRIALDGDGPTLTPRGPEIWLVTEGEVRAGDLRLARGESVFVSAADGAVEVGGAAVFFRATTGD